MQNTDNHTIDLLKDALLDRGYTIHDLTLAEKNFTKFVAPNGGTWITRNAQINYPFVSCTATQISNDKNMAYSLAREKGVRVPFTVEVTKENASKVVPAELLKHGTLIVKPNNSTLSRGLTLGIKTKEELQQALDSAFAFDERALVQEQVSGEEIRFALLQGKVQAAILRQKPHLVGDGTSTVAELVDKEDAARLSVKDTAILYPRLNEVVDLTSLTMSNVLALGERIELGKGTMIRSGASMYNVKDTIHPSYIQTVELLASELGAGFFVIDMMLDDYTKPRSATNYAFIEFNKAPVLKLFYSCRDGRHFDVLRELVPMIDKAITNSVQELHVLGSFENVAFPEFGVDEALAKVDTGAYTGALYSPAAHVIQNSDGKDILKFSLFHEPEKFYETDTFETIRIRSSNGQTEDRYVIKTNILIDGKEYATCISLTDRSKMRCPVLLGRKFIRENNMIVDVSLNEQFDDDILESKI